MNVRKAYEELLRLRLLIIEKQQALIEARLAALKGTRS